MPAAGAPEPQLKSTVGSTRATVRAGEVDVVVVRRRQTRAGPAGGYSIGRGVGGVRRRRGDVVHPGAAVRPGDELIGRSAGRLRRGRFERSNDADDACERNRRRARLAVEQQLQRGWTRGERQLNRARADVPERHVGQAAGIANRQMDPVPDIRLGMPRGRNRERSTAGAGGWRDERVDVRVVMEIHLPGERARRQRALLGIRRRAGVVDDAAAAVERAGGRLRDVSRSAAGWR